MNEQQLQILKTLKEACFDPSIKQSADEKLKQHLNEIGILASHLLVELVGNPAFKTQAVSAYATAAQDIERFLVEQKRDTATAATLAQCAASSDPAQLDACFAIARDLQLELRTGGSREGDAWQKRLIEIEVNHSRQVVDALQAHITPAGDEDAVPAVGQTKSFDKEKLENFFIKSFPAEKGIRVVETRFFSGGSSKYTMGIRLAGVKDLPEEVVLRGDSASSANFGGASSVDEFRLLTIVHQHGGCVPKPLAVEATGEVFGTPFMLVEKRTGKAIGHMFNLPGQNKTIGCDIAEQLARIHCVPTAAIGDWIKGAKRSTSDQVIATLDESYANWQALQRPSPVFEAAFKWLRANVEIMDRSRGLVHGDYALHNMLIDGDKVSAVLDWEFAHIGNPAYDLGYFYHQAESLSSWEEFLQAYEAAGAQRPSPEELDYSILFAATRLGVMVCQGEAAFRGGIAPGLFMSLIAGRYTHQISITRLEEILRRVL